MIQHAEREAGAAAAYRLREELEAIRRLRRASRGPRWRDAADLDRLPSGELLIHRQNLPAVLVWLQVSDQWIVSPMGEPIALDMRTALEFTRELRNAAPSDQIDVLDTTGRLKILAGEVLNLQRRKR